MSMSLPEQAAYLRGLADGQGLNPDSSKEAKLLSAAIDLLCEMAQHVQENEDSITALADQLDDVSDAVEDLDELVLGTGDDEEDEDDDGADAESGVTSFEVECPNCQATLILDEDDLSRGTVVCPSCGQTFEIDVGFSEDEGDQEPDGGDEPPVNP